LLISSTYLLRILSRVLLLERLSGALKGIVIEYFKPEIFTLRCLLKIKYILNFLIGFLIRIERIVSLYRCFYNATNKEGIEYRPFIRRPRFFKKLLIVVS
jgi:hypothetical protein